MKNPSKMSQIKLSRFLIIFSFAIFSHSILHSQNENVRANKIIKEHTKKLLTSYKNYVEISLDAFESIKRDEEEVFNSSRVQSLDQSIKSFRTSLAKQKRITVRKINIEILSKDTKTRITQYPSIFFQLRSINNEIEEDNRYIAKLKNSKEGLNNVSKAINIITDLYLKLLAATQNQTGALRTVHLEALKIWSDFNFKIKKNLSKLLQDLTTTIYISRNNSEINKNFYLEELKGLDEQIELDLKTVNNYLEQYQRKISQIKEDQNRFSERKRKLRNTLGNINTAKEFIPIIEINIANTVKDKKRILTKLASVSKSLKYVKSGKYLDNYTDCPNKTTWASCTHKKEKSTYLNQRKRKIKNYEEKITKYNVSLEQINSHLNNQKLELEKLDKITKDELSIRKELSITEEKILKKKEELQGLEDNGNYSLAKQFKKLIPIIRKLAQ